MPIKGTRPRGEAAELRASEKDAAEHVMIVDLERNDLSRVCEAGTVRWPELMATRELAGVEHMVSTVEGTLRDGVGLAEILDATFPGGSVTGAPKIAAVDLIAELEPVGRGASMGAIGPRLRERGLRPRAHDPDLRDRRRRDPSLGRRRHRLGLRPGGRGRGVVDEGAPAARRDRLAASGGGARMTVLALAVTGRGLVDPTEPVIRADDEGLLRGRAAFETLRVYGGRPFRLEAHLDRLTASAASIGLPAVERRRLQVLVGLVLPKAAGGDASLRLVWTAGPAGGTPSALALLSDIPDWIESTRERGATAVSLARRPSFGAVAPPGREVDELRGEHGGRGGGAPTRSRRGALRRRGRDRPRGDGDERLVARRRDAVHAVARPRDPRRRDEGDAHGARARVRLSASRRARTRSSSSSPPRRRSRPPPFASSCRSSRSTDGTSDAVPRADALQAALRELAAKV